MYINLLIRIKNAQAAGKKSMKVPYSKMDYSIAELLAEYRFIKNAEVKGKSYKKVIEIDCGAEHPIRNVDFVSKPSVRRYSGYKDLMSVKSGHGILIVSTPKGIMTSIKAKHEKVGGELLCKIW